MPIIDAWKNLFYHNDIKTQSQESDGPEFQPTSTG